MIDDMMQQEKRDTHKKRRLCQQDVAPKEDGKETSTADNDSLSLVAKIFLEHGGLGYLSNFDIFPSIPLVNKSFRDTAAQVLTERCKILHPSLYKVVTDSGNRITWPKYCRFELDEEESRKMPLSPAVQLADIDVLIEVSQRGSLVWHAVEPLQLNPGDGLESGPGCTFRLPQWSFEAPVRQQVDLVGVQSLLPKVTLKNALCKRGCVPVNVRVVWRQRSTGKLATVVDSNAFEGISRRHHDPSTGTSSFVIEYISREYLDDNESLILAKIVFELHCSGANDLDAMSFNYSTERVAKVGFEICHPAYIPDDEAILSMTEQWHWA